MPTNCGCPEPCPDPLNVPIDLGCVQAINTECVTYNGDNVPCIEVMEGDNLSNIIKILAEELCALENSMTTFSCEDLSTCSLDNIGDTIITTPTANQYLTFNGTNWVNVNFPNIPNSFSCGDLNSCSINALADVNVNPTNGQVLTWNSLTNSWVSTTITIPPSLTYSVNNGLSESPSDNFQLGGALIKNTIIDGDNGGTDFNFTLSNLNLFTSSAERFIFNNKANHVRYELGKNNTFNGYGSGSFLGFQLFEGEDNVINSSKGKITGYNNNMTDSIGYIIGDDNTMSLAKGYLFGENSSMTDGVGGFVLGENINIIGNIIGGERTIIALGTEINVTMGLLNTTGHTLINLDNHFNLNQGKLHNGGNILGGGLDYNFIVRANYAKFILNNSNTNYIEVEQGVPGWTYVSSKDTKENIENIDYNNILKCLDKIDIYKWSYKDADNKENYHTSIMAEDFHETFSEYVNCTNKKSIATGDIDGINTALIKALYERVKLLENKS